MYPHIPQHDNIVSLEVIYLLQISENLVLRLLSFQSGRIL